jgi:hypothetical protein
MGRFGRKNPAPPPVATKDDLAALERSIASALGTLHERTAAVNSQLAKLTERLDRGEQHIARYHERAEQLAAQITALDARVRTQAAADDAVHRRLQEHLAAFELRLSAPEPDEAPEPQALPAPDMPPLAELVDDLAALRLASRANATEVARLSVELRNELSEAVDVITRRLQSMATPTRHATRPAPPAETSPVEGRRGDPQPWAG